MTEITRELMKQENIIFIDIETNDLIRRGNDGGYPYIIQFAAVAHNLEKFFVPYIKPNFSKFEMNRKAQDVHNISYEDLYNRRAELQTFQQVWHDFMLWTNQFDKENIFLVAYNGFHFDFLVILYRLYHTKIPTQKKIFFIDPLHDLIESFPNFMARKDELIKSIWHRANWLRHHKADSDARALKKIFDELVHMIPFRVIEFTKLDEVRIRSLRRYNTEFQQNVTIIKYCGKDCCYKNLPVYKKSKIIKKHQIKFCQFYCPVCKQSKYWKQSLVKDKQRIDFKKIIESYTTLENKLKRKKNHYRF